MSQKIIEILQELLPTWLPPYTIHFSARTKRVSLKIVPYIGVQIILPEIFKTDLLLHCNSINKKNKGYETLEEFFSKTQLNNASYASVSKIFSKEYFLKNNLIRDLLKLLEKNENWIKKNYLKIQFSLSDPADSVLPKKIILRATNEEWKVLFQNEKKSTSLKLLEEEKKIIILAPPKTSKKNIIFSLEQWIIEYAQNILLPWFHELSKQHKFTFNQVRVNHTTAQWGSCSVQKNISLNCRLLFLTPELVNYVMLHELCHTIHLNHSQSFWKLLKSHSPNYMSLKEQLRQGYEYLPRWITLYNSKA